MVCWLALCLGRKVEERLGKKCQGAARRREGTEGEEGLGWREGGGRVKATEWKSFQIYTENVIYVVF